MTWLAPILVIFAFIIGWLFLLDRKVERVERELRMASLEQDRRRTHGFHG